MGVNEYISSMVGKLPEGFYYVLDENHVTIIHAYSKLTGRRETITPAVLKAEYDLAGFHTGKDIYYYLTKCGFSDYSSTEAVKRLAANEFITEELIEEGYDKDTISYEMTYRERMYEAGFESISIMKSYAMRTEIEVRPIRIIAIAPPLPPPPLEYEVWCTFQVSMLIDCETKDKRGRGITRSIEFRGIFTAEKNAICNWEKLGESQRISEDIIGQAIVTAETVITEYAFHKGYFDLVKCSAVVFSGANLMESTPEEVVYIDDIDVHETDAMFSVIDLDHNDRKAFDDSILYVGEWWKDKEYAIIEMKKQAEQME